MLNIIKSNRMEHLMDAFVRLLAAPLNDPLLPEWVGIQSRGMKQWISMELAKDQGICANFLFLFPRQIIDRILAPAAAPFSSETGSQKDILLWRIMACLPDLIHQPEFKSINRYVKEDPAGLRLFQLSTRIARVFDDYLVYRPDGIIAWEGFKGAADAEQSGLSFDFLWQPLLWKRINENGFSDHVARRSHRFFNNLNDPRAHQRFGERPDQRSGQHYSYNFGDYPLPSRISLFGISAVPPLFLKLFEAASAAMDIYLFLLTPSREFWGHIVSEKQIGKLAARVAAEPFEVEALHLETGNPLLAAMGKSGRDFFSLLENAAYLEPAGDLWQDPRQDSEAMLPVLQSDILHLIHRRGSPGDPVAKGFPGDGSVAVHACHSPMREAQVLKDQLLDLFESDQALSPHDVIVMMPDVEAYGPYIEAVFSMEETLPFTISDRRQRFQSQTADCFLQILKAVGSRLPLGRVMDILSMDPVRLKFDFTHEEVKRLGALAMDAGICWGMDADHRKASGLPGVHDNTWQFGLRRLMLGYAMPGKPDTLFADFLPFTGIEGLDGEILGRFARFCHRFFRQIKRLVRPRTVPQWCDALTELLAALISSSGAHGADYTLILEAVSRLRELTVDAGCHREVTLEVMQGALEGHLDATRATGAFFTGGITVCNLMPMRSIPFKVVALMGMNDGAFPRQVIRESFDLMKQQPRMGDRIIRDEERYLFLEALLSARERFIITYTGMGLTDNAPIPPATVVSELLDVIHDSFDIPDQNSLVRFHPLQPFSKDYFRRSDSSDRVFFSYSGLNGAIAGRLGQTGKQDSGARKESQTRPFFPRALSPWPEAHDTAVEGLPVTRILAIDDLVRFFNLPVAFMMKNRLGIALEKPKTYSDDREPVELDGLAHFSLGRDILGMGMAQGALGGLYPFIRATGSLPHGNRGVMEYSGLLQGADPVHRAFLSDRVNGETLDPVYLDIAVGPLTLSGTITGISSRARCHHSFGRLTPKRILKAWIYHLALNILGPRGYPLISDLVCRDKTGSGIERLRFPLLKKEDAYLILSDLVRLFVQGMARPLIFFPDTSWALALALDRAGKNLSKEELFKTVAGVRSVWLDPFRGQGEGLDRYVALLFQGRDPFDDIPGLIDSGFVETASAVFGPVIAAMEVL